MKSGRAWTKDEIRDVCAARGTERPDDLARSYGATKSAIAGIWHRHDAPERFANMEPTGTRVRRIIAEVSEKHGLPVHELHKSEEICSRAVPLVRARHELFSRLYQETRLSYLQIGKRLGGFDHTTVLWGVKAHERRMAQGRSVSEAAE